MKITFVRHGQTTKNAERCFNFDNTELTEKGIKQAMETGEKLKDENFDICFCSPFTRTIQTANEIVCYHPGLPVVFDDRIRERDYGFLKGKSPKDLPFDRWDLNCSYENIPMESPKEVVDRVYDFFNELKDADYDNVLIVSHSGINRATSAVFNGIPESNNLSEYSIKNGEINIFELEPNQTLFKIQQQEENDCSNEIQEQ